MLRILTPAAGLIVTAALIAGCGGSNNNGNGGSTNSSSSSASFRSAGLKMAQCMRANGVPSFPDPGANGSPGAIQASPGTSTIGGVAVPSATLQAAFQKCRKELPQGPPISQAQITKLRQGALKMAQCMRANGVPNFPDPDITTGPGGHGIGIRIGGPPPGGSAAARGKPSGPPAFTQTPAFKSAQQKCMPLLRGALPKLPGRGG